MSSSIGVATKMRNNGTGSLQQCACLEFSFWFHYSFEVNFSIFSWIFSRSWNIRTPKDVSEYVKNVCILLRMGHCNSAHALNFLSDFIIPLRLISPFFPAFFHGHMYSKWYVYTKWYVLKVQKWLHPAQNNPSCF